jgi:hypothetical protein
MGLGAGCSSITSAPVAPAAQHGGSMFSLSNGGGFVELLVKGQGEPKRRTRQVRQVQYTAYFYQEDGTTPMSPPPTEVRLKIGTADKATAVSFEPPAQSEGAAPASMFVSKLGSYPDGFQGELEAKIDGAPVTADIMIR